jgi:lincosamide nucleotidyltransferase A/C/D/E
VRFLDESTRFLSHVITWQAGLVEAGDEKRSLSAQDALSLYAMFLQHHIRCWVTGGWGVDALLGHETRPHHDLDLLVSFDDLGQVQDLLAEQGFSRKLVWEENRWVEVHGARRPTAFVERDALGRELDIHVIQLVEEGPPFALFDHAWDLHSDSLDGVGSISGAPVACVSAATQLQAHTGYDLLPQHQSDVDHLRRLVDE